MNKKVLVISTVDFDLNGITAVIMNYYQNMDKTDLKIDFLIPNNPNKCYVDIFKSNGSNYYVCNRKKNVFKYLSFLKNILKENKYDVVHIHGQNTNMGVELFLAKKCKVKTRIAHSHNTSVNHRFMHYMFMPFFKHQYTHALACSKSAGAWLFNKKSFEVFNNGIDLDKFKYNESNRKIIRLKHSIDDSTTVFGHVGLFNEQKNHSFLIDVFNEYHKLNNDSKLLLIGEGPKLQEIKDKINSLSLNNNVIFVNKTSDVYKYYSAMDCFVFPSLWEGLGIVSIEAQANGLPTFVSNQIPEEANLSQLFYRISLDKTSFEWAKYILSIVELGERNNLSLNNLESFDIKNLANNLRNIYLGK